MLVRKSLSGLVALAVAGSALAFAATPAVAAEAYDPSFTPVSADLIGVGSDTTEIAMHYAAEGFSGIPGFNDGKTTGRIVSFQAGGGGQITLPNGAIDRPNGSGAGKGRLYGANNAPEVDFARSSSSLSDAEVAAGLQQFPFAVDGLKLAVSGNVASHAPASISAADMVKIYDGTYKTWNQVPGGTSTAAIKPLIPQAGSGTRSFFTAQLKSANGGVDVTLAPTVTEVQEHDPAPIKDDADAIAPFSTGRAKAAGAVIKLEDGFLAQRALYNVVRGADLARADLQGAFGPSGFLCSDAARALIEASGFFQLARSSAGGVCGEATQTATTNFKANTLAYDPTFAPQTTDLVAVGSDTTEVAMHYVAEGQGDTAGYNAGKSTGRIASFQAGGGGKIVLPGGQVIDRPNGSGAGKGRLYGANNAPEVDFARSSSSLSDAEVAAGLQQLPFAVDGLKLAVSGNVASHAPASISAADMVKIYDGTYKTWNQVPGGTSTAAIKPLIPQAGSGTRSFFTAQLKSANGGVDVTLAPTVTEVQEHDPTPIKDDADAIAPFSTGRAALAGSVIKLEDGFSAQRALYNVVRGADLARADLTSAIGSTGFICSDAARTLIEASGFFQLARPEDGGACGQATQSATTNFAVNDGVTEVETTTSLAATSTAANKVSLVATVAADGQSPTGTVTFTEGGTVVKADVPVTGGQASASLTGVAAGSHTYTATYTPADGTAFLESSDTATVSVSDPVVLSAKAKPVKKGKTAKVKVTVEGASTGTVSLLKGSKEIDSASLSGGKATLKATKVKKTTTYTVVFGDQSVKVKVTVKK